MTDDLYRSLQLVMLRLHESGTEVNQGEVLDYCAEVASRCKVASGYVLKQMAGSPNLSEHWRHYVGCSDEGEQ